jgi:serine protease AprX
MSIKHRLACLGIISVISSSGLQAASISSFSTIPLNPKIDSYVVKQFQALQFTTKQAKVLKNKSLQAKQKINNSVFVILKEQADLSAADAFQTREEKGRYVYDTLRNLALNTQAPLVKFLQTQKVEFRQFYIQNMIAVENPSLELINILAKRDDVAKISGNPKVSLKLPHTKASLSSERDAAGPERNLVRIGATKVWETYNTRGEGIVVAGQDTGVQWDHPALRNQYRGASTTKIDHNYNWHDAVHHKLTAGPDTNENFASCGYDSKTPCDDAGHGTHTIGTVVGDDGKGNQIGVAPKAQWIACKNMDRGVGSAQTYNECFEFFLAPYPINGNALKQGDPKKAPHIINNSWGCVKDEGCSGDEILASLKAMKQAGIFVVASAGNDGPSCATIGDPPAWHTGLSLTVGAFDHRSDKIAYFSSRGPSARNGGIGPNISAPGVSIRSSVPGGRYESAMWSGTSMAGPHAVGAAALLWSHNKNLIGNIEQTIALLEKSAEAKTTTENCGGLPGTHIPNNTYGSGLLNVAQAIALDSSFAG